MTYLYLFCGWLALGAVVAGFWWFILAGKRADARAAGIGGRYEDAGARQE